jgi:hypothetical protein
MFLAAYLQILGDCLHLWQRFAAADGCVFMVDG